MHLSSDVGSAQEDSCTPTYEPNDRWKRPRLPQNRLDHQKLPKFEQEAPLDPQESTRVES